MQKHIPQGQGSAQSFIAILGENIPQIQVNALKNLNRMVDFAWAEMADSLPKFEAFMDDPKFPERALAASVASKVLYFMEQYDDALRLALEAGDYFDLAEKSQYVETLINKCIDRYIKLRQEQVDKNDQSVRIEPKMEMVIDKMFNRCF